FWYHIGRKILPVNMFDKLAVFLYHLERFTTTEPQITCIEIDAKSFGIATVEHLAHKLDGIGDVTMRLKKDLYSIILCKSQRFIKLFCNREYCFGCGKLLPERSPGLAVGGNHMLHAYCSGHLNRLYDLRSTITGRRCR